MTASIQSRRQRTRKHKNTAVGQFGKLPRLHSLICTGILVKTDTVPHPIEPAWRNIALRGARRIEDCIELVEEFARQCVDQPQLTDASVFVPHFVELSDEDGRLVLCGQVLSWVVDWCPPVQTPGEAKLVHARCVRLRDEILSQDNLDSFSALDRLCDCEEALSGRLVDPLWRGEAGKVLKQREVRRMRAMRNATQPVPTQKA
ncbi:hypothetical protein V8099_003840 [Pseudomonas aeruginosa]|nr:hypothetical protein [Pseudomonas aeruginosa]